MKRAAYEILYNKCLNDVMQYIAQETDEKARFAIDFSLRHHMELNKEHLFHCANKEGVHQCVVCGVLTASNFIEPTKSRMQENKTCFHCDCWQGRAIEHQNKPKLIIDGYLYTIGSNPEGGRFNGMGGRKFVIEHEDGRVSVTYDLWAGGTIPTQFRGIMKDNAKFAGGASFSGQAWNAST